jgi:threonine dehydratase
MEIEEQGGRAPDSVLVSVGGGGLIAGVAAWFEDRSRVVALEPELAPTLYRAREAGAPVDVAVSGIAADSLGAKRIGAIAWDITQRHVPQACWSAIQRSACAADAVEGLQAGGGTGGGAGPGRPASGRLLAAVATRSPAW